VTRKNENPDTLSRKMDGPSGIDLHPEPPNAVRVSKRAGLIVLCLICGLASLFGFGVYRRQQNAASDIYDGGAQRKVAPATLAAKEITRNIPEGVINLATEGGEPASAAGATNNKSQAAGAPETAAVKRQQPTREPETPATPTPEERRLAQAYARELQAIAAPTSTRSLAGTAGSALPPYLPPIPPGNNASPLAALAELFQPRTAPQTPASRRTGSDREFEEQNMQNEKRAFLAQAGSSRTGAYLASTRTPALSEFEIKAGWEIPAILEQELNSDLPGELKALVTANVYDTATGKHLLIPQGARLVGSYDSNVGFGQNGLQVVWHRIIYPDASSIDLSGMVGQDAHGSSGFRGDVDNHYKRLIGFAALSSLFSAGFQLSQPNRSVLQTPSAGEIAAGAVGQEITQVGAQITRKNLNIQPTIKIPIGYRFSVRVNRDMLFEGPY
jgi:type IV secretory pathway VirB10-like protein